MGMLVPCWVFSRALSYFSTFGRQQHFGRVASVCANTDRMAFGISVCVLFVVNQRDSSDWSDHSAMCDTFG